MDCRMPGFLIHHQLLKLTQTHVYHFGNAIQTSDTLSVPSPLAFNFSQHEGLFYESGLSIKWPKYWSFSFTIGPYNKYSGLIYFLDRLVGSPCCPSSKASILLHSAFFIFQFSHSYMTTGKTIALTRRTFVGKVMSLLFNRVSKAMAPHSSTVARKIPGMEDPGRLQSTGSLRVRHGWPTSLSLSTFMHWRRKWRPTPVFLPGESHGRRSLVGCSPWGHTESDTTAVT